MRLIPFVIVVGSCRVNIALNVVYFISNPMKHIAVIVTVLGTVINITCSYCLWTIYNLNTSTHRQVINLEYSLVLMHVFMLKFTGLYQLILHELLLIVLLSLF